MYYSPLRYPGGKNKLTAFIAKICTDNCINKHYVEPYAGGASVALFLLLEGYVEKITINDKDRSIYAFWYSVLHYTDRLCELIEECEISVATWNEQKEIQRSKEKTGLLSLGFSTLFLNRTNRSGIISGGILGGINQDGEYKIDCRFNKEEIINRIRIIAAKKNKIKVSRKDAIDLILSIDQRQKKPDTIVYFDPPYYYKASSLYLNYYKKKDHLEVSTQIKKLKNISWIVSYDNVDEIKQLYSGCITKEYSFKHTAYKSREGKEILFFSPNLILPDIPNWEPLNFKCRKRKNQRTIIYKSKK